MLNSFLKNAYDISAVGFSGDKGFGIFRFFSFLLVVILFIKVY